MIASTLSFVLCTFAFLGVQASPTAPNVADCKTVIQRAGASAKWAEHAGHAVHAFTVQDLQKFEPAVSAKNKVPTVNRNMVGSDGVLPAAPDFKSADNDRFKTDIMKILDVVLSSMDNKEYFRRYTSTLELVAHEAHMHEHWAHILEQYKALNKQPLGADFCKCAMDVDNNGLMDVLRNAALLIREPKLTLGYDPSNVTQGDLRYYMLYAVVVYPEKLTHELFQRPEGYQLTGAAAWKKFKSEYPVSPVEVRDAAMFLHCALKEERDNRKRE